MRKIIPFSIILATAAGLLGLSTLGSTAKLFGAQAETCSHPAGAVNHYAEKAPTCEEAGHIEYWVCCQCHVSSADADFTSILDTGSTVGTNYASDDDRYLAPSHVLGEYVVTQQPTIHAEGKATRECGRCDHVEEYNILALPTVKYSGGKISWDAVEGAEGYKLINGDNVTDLGNVLSTTLDVNNSELGVRAYTTDKAYYEYGMVNVDIPTTGTNLQIGFISDFYDQGVVLGANSGWSPLAPGNGNFFPNFDWSIYTEADGNMAARTMVSAGNVNGIETWEGILKDLGGTNAAGDYQLTFRLKLSAEAAKNKATRNIYANVIWDGGFVGLFMLDHSFNTYEADTWYNCSATFTKPATGWAQIQFFHYTTVPATRSVDDYILIDDVEIHTSNGAGGFNSEDVDNVGDGTFEIAAVRTLGKVSANVGWCLNDSVFTEGTSAGTDTGIIQEADGNRAFKVKGNTDCVEFDLKGNPAITSAGTYVLKFDIKAGEDSTLRNIGFRGWGAAGQAIPDVTVIWDEHHGITSTEYKTFEAVFTTPGLVSGWLNIFFWSFSGSDVNTSANNYFLLDNVEVYRVA